MKKGKFISLEGLSNSGKTLLCRSLPEYLHNSDLIITPFFELSSPVGRILDGYFRNKREMSPRFKAMMFSIDRRFICENGLINELKNGRNVIIDRYFYTNCVYRCLEGIDIQWLETLEKDNPLPNLTIFIDIDPQESLRRARVIKKPTPYSSELLNDARKKYMDFVKSGLMKKVNGMQSREKLKKDVATIIIEHLRKA